MNWMAKLSKKIAFIIACLTGTTGVAAAAPVTGGASLAAAGAVSADVSSIVIMLGGIVVNKAKRDREEHKWLGKNVLNVISLLFLLMEEMVSVKSVATRCRFPQMKGGAEEGRNV